MVERSAFNISYVAMTRRENNTINRRRTGPANLRELLESRANATPEKFFLFSESDGRRYTYSEFDAAVNRTVRLLAALGLSKGDKVSLLMPNSAEYIIAYFACFKMGALAGPLNSLLKSPEMAYVMANSESKALIVNTEFLPKIENIREQLPALEAVIVFDDEIESTKNYSDDREPLPVLPIETSDEAIIIYTSGTTGKPKGCLLTHGNLLANARQIASWLGFTERDRLLTVMPPVSYERGIGNDNDSALCRRFLGSKPEVFCFTILADYLGLRSDFFRFGGDDACHAFGEVSGWHTVGMKSEQLRFAMCGSAPVPAEVMKRFEETFRCLVIEGYGLSESTCRSTFNPPDTRRRPGSCGMPIGNEMKIVDEADREVANGSWARSYCAARTF